MGLRPVPSVSRKAADNAQVVATSASKTAKIASKTAQMVQDSPQVRPIWSKMAAKTAQESPRCL
eukprot:5689715-Pyramimonas_sp.AAC.1